MQISRHWRMNSQRYRLEGVQYETGQVALQARPVVKEDPGIAEGASLRVKAKTTETAAISAA